MRKRNKAFLGTVGDADIRLMRVFAKVVECGSLSAAETLLGVGRSTISRQLADLELRLGLRLCHRQRGRRGLELTQHGEKALAHIKRFLAVTNSFSEDMRNIDNDLVGYLNIGLMDYTSADTRNPILNAIQRFKKQSPHVMISTFVGSPNDIERRVIDHQLHLGLLHRYHPIQELNYIPLYQERVGLFAAGNHPAAKAIRNGEALSESQILEYELIYRGYREADLQLDLKQRFRRGPTVHETEAVEILVRAGVYLGYLPVHSYAGAPQDFIELLPGKFGYEFPVSIVYAKDRVQSSLLDGFLKILKETAVHLND